ncbi:MAG TPA: hypothetical protein VFF36_02600, partial [Planctomycetota bacterium]|nr:hypothetical protein [Planctomycetota bacterium]
LQSIADDGLRARVEAAAGEAPNAEPTRGDVVVDATWTGGGDLDLSLVTPQGSRVSWMGGRTGAFGSNVTSTRTETLGLRRAPAGEWIVEINRTGGDASQAVSGSASVTVLGVHRTLSFTIPAGQSHAEIGRAVVTRVETYQRVWN